MACVALGVNAASASFTLLEPVPEPKIVKHSVAYPGGRYGAENLLDGRSDTEYSSDSGGTNTYVEFDFGAEVNLAAVRHVDRNS